MPERSPESGAEGRLLTVLFTDIVGSTELTARLGDRSARTVRTLHDRLVRKQLVAHGGHEVQTTGDGFLVTFRSVERAVACACAIQRAQSEHNRRQPEHALRVRVGLNAGEVSTRDDGLFGSAVNLAARVTAKAAPGEILVSEIVRQLGGQTGEVEFRDRGRFRLKGFPNRWRLYEVRWSEAVTASPAPARSAADDHTQHANGSRAHSDDLPVTPSSFVGREVEVAEVVRLAMSKRLVTLVGPGGVGKTRLAIQAARALQAQFPAGVHFVGLSGVADGSLVDEAVVTSLGLHADSRRHSRQVISDHFAGQRLLLVVDNCEHVIEASAGLLGHLLNRCPELHAVATSREPLILPGEQVRHVPPLGLPATGESLDEDPFSRHSALRLFAERAEEAGAATSVSSRDVKLVAEICQRLDGLPLALELAASRMRALSLAGLVAQLSDHERFRVLTTGSRTAEDRHRTLRATVEWSYRLLSPEERLLFARLSVFATSFDARSARQVCGLSPITQDAVLELLLGLADKSLVEVTTGAEGDTRYRMLDTLRAYGWERLIESGEQEAIRERQALHFADVLAEPVLTWTRAALDGIRNQLDDVRASLGWSCTNRPELATRICGSLVGFWGRLGPLEEGRQWLDRLIRGLPEDDDNKAIAFANACWLAQRNGDFEVASHYAREELRVAHVLGDDWAVADALKRLADVARHEGHYDLALPYAEESVVLRRALRGREGNDLELGLSLMILGGAQGRQGDRKTGRLNLEEAIGVFASIDEGAGVALCQGWLGELALREGSLQEARELLSTSLRAFRELPDAWMVANLLDLLCWLASREDESYRLLRLAGAAAALRQKSGAAAVPVLAELLDPLLREARSWAGAGADAAWRQGADSGPEQAIAYGLREVAWQRPSGSMGRPSPLREGSGMGSPGTQETTSAPRVSSDD
jgi:predicted ATPase/class 3 adenylate cyclase